jgi:hypothetical protein
MKTLRAQQTNLAPLLCKCLASFLWTLFKIVSAGLLEWHVSNVECGTIAICTPHACTLAALFQRFEGPRAQGSGTKMLRT